MAASFLPVTELHIYDEEGKKAWVQLYAMFSANPKEIDMKESMEVVKLLQGQIQRGIEAVEILSKLKRFIKDK